MKYVGFLSGLWWVYVGFARNMLSAVNPLALMCKLYIRSSWLGLYGFTIDDPGRNPKRQTLV